MESGRLIFDSSSSSSPRGRLILLGRGNPVFRGVRSLVAAEDGGASKRRPFFTSPDEIYEEYYEEQLPEKKRRLTTEQINMLERSFDEENKLEPERKSELAKKLGLQPRQVAVWFQNRRARWKNKQLEHEFDRLKANHDALLLDHDALREDNERLRSQVNLLMVKLQAHEQGASGVTALTPDDRAASNSDLMALNFQQRLEDMLSSGSGRDVAGGAQGMNHHPVEFGRDSLPLESYQCAGQLVNAGIISEDDVSDEGCSQYSVGLLADEWWGWNS